MTPATKQSVLHWAEVFDSLRVVPRVILFLYCFYVYHITEIVLQWYFRQDANGRGTQESALIGVVITAVTGFAPLIYKIYSDGGRNWNAQVSSSTTTASTISSVTPVPASTE